MQRKWIKTMAATMALLAVTAGTAAAESKEPVAPEMVEVRPISAELVTLEGTVKWNDLEGGFWELDGWMLVGDKDLLQAVNGQQVWALGTRDDGMSIFMVPRLNVERLERPVAMNRTLPKTVVINGKAMESDQAPFMHKGTLMLPLRALVEAAGGKIEWNQETFSAHVVMSDRNADFIVGQNEAEMNQHNVMYLTRNMLKMDQQVVLQNGRMFVSADAVTTILGMHEAISKDETVLDLRFPAGFFEVPGDVVGIPAEEDISYNLKWSGTMLEITGKANVPDLHFEIKLEGKVVAQADAQVKEGTYIANILVEGGAFQAGKLELVISDPATGRELASGPAGNHLR